jgi:hypothetical protein
MLCLPLATGRLGIPRRSLLCSDSAERLWLVYPELPPSARAAADFSTYLPTG